MSRTMRAVALAEYGPLEKLVPMTLPLPEPGKGEVLVRVHASALNPADYKVALGQIKLLHARNFPMVLGYDFSGVIEAVGPGVTALKIGDEAFGFLPYGPFNRRGAFAEALVARVDEIARKPKNVSHAQAAASATTGLTALQALEGQASLRPNGSVLVTGVSGGVGSIAIPIARRLGATVVGLGSGRGLDLARSLGADSVIDRKQGDVFQTARGPFDVVLDAAAAYRWSQWKGMLKRGGTFVTTLPSLSFVVDKARSVLSSSRVGLVGVKSRPRDLEKLAEWLGSGLTVPIEATVPVRDVGKGLARLLEGQVLGRLSVDVLNGFGS
jgi:NADPH:quinone reductase